MFITAGKQWSISNITSINSYLKHPWRTPYQTYSREEYQATNGIPGCFLRWDKFPTSQITKATIENEAHTQAFTQLTKWNSIVDGIVQITAAYTK